MPCAVTFAVRGIFLQFALDFVSVMWYYSIVVKAGMMELADVLDSKSSGSDTVRVRPPLPAPKRKTRISVSFFLCLCPQGHNIV